MKVFTNALLVSAAALLMPLQAAAAEWPNRPVTMLVGFPAGNSIDAVARLLADHLAKKFGQPFVVDNRTGANGMLAVQGVRDAGTDDHVLLVSNSSSLTVNPQLYPDAKVDPLTDLKPVTKVVATPFIMVVNPENPRTKGVETLADLLKVAKEKPGELSYGSPGVGNLAHLAGEVITRRAGVEIEHVPYRGTNPMQMGLTGGEIDVGFDNPAGIALMRAGTLKPIAITGKDGWPDLPDVTSVHNQGLEGFDVTFWSGIFLPGAASDEVRDRLHAALMEVKDDAELMGRLALQGRPKLLSVEDFVEELKAEIATNTETIKAANIIVQ